MTDIDQVKEYILKKVIVSSRKYTPIRMESKIKNVFGLEKKTVRTIIKSLISANELTYTYQFGNTFLVKSFNRPVRISNRVILIPPAVTYSLKHEDVLVRIKPGISFGSGEHPTTRLAIRGIEFAMEMDQKDQIVTYETHLKVLDIGTGSGVLLLTALKFGCGRGVGVDIDSCARMEAIENIELNNLADRTVIADRLPEGSFHMVIANLRYPSLIDMSEMIYEVLEKNGIAVLSGIKSDERDEVMNVYIKNGFKNVWVETENNWVGVVLGKEEG